MAWSSTECSAFEVERRVIGFTEVEPIIFSFAP